MESLALICGHLVGDYFFQTDSIAKTKTSSSAACLAHCVSYAAAINIFCFPYFPWWVPVVAGAVHFPIDRWSLAKRWMLLIDQKEFATGQFSPWSIIVVDNSIHIITLFLLGLLSKGCL